MPFDRKTYYVNYSKKYYEEHKQHKQEYAKKLRKCEICEKDIKNSSYRLHLKSVKHILNMKNKDLTKQLEDIKNEKPEQK